MRVLPPSQLILQQEALLTLKRRVQTSRSLPTDAEGLGKDRLLGREDGGTTFLPLVFSVNTCE